MQGVIFGEGQGAFAATSFLPFVPGDMRAGNAFDPPVANTGGPNNTFSQEADRKPQVFRLPKLPNANERPKGDFICRIEKLRSRFSTQSFVPGDMRAGNALPPPVRTLEGATFPQVSAPPEIL